MRYFIQFRRGFTLVEVMIVVAIIAILAAIAIPQLITSRKMTRQNRCMNNLRILDHAMDQLALQIGAAPGDYITGDDHAAEFLKHLKDGFPDCPSGGGYAHGVVGENALCTFHGTIAAPTPLDTLTAD